jgi:hypothetical protein
MLYKRGRYYWMRFRWHGTLIRESTRAEDLPTARRILGMYRSKLAIEQERRRKFGDTAAVKDALYGDLRNHMAKGKSVERALSAGQEKARIRIEKMKDKMAFRKFGIKA